MKRHEKMTAPRMLEVVYKRPNKPPRVKMIVGTREAIESMVGGPFELTALIAGGGRARECGRLQYGGVAIRRAGEHVRDSRPVPRAGAGRRGALRCDRPARGMPDAGRPESRSIRTTRRRMKEAGMMDWAKEKAPHTDGDRVRGQGKVTV